MDPKERREDAGEDRHLESEEGSYGEGKSSGLRKEESSNSFVSAEEDPEENPSEESRKNPRESRRTSKKDIVGDEIQELESPEEKIQGTNAEIPEEFQEGNPRIEDECKETEDLQTSLPPEQVDTGKLDELFTYSTGDIEESSDSEPRLRRKNTRRRVDFDKDVSVENVESGKDVGDISKQMEELPSAQLGQEKSKDAEIEVVADSATETEVLKSKEDDEPEVDSRAQKVESKKPKAKSAERKGKVSDSRVIAEQRAVLLLGQKMRNYWFNDMKNLNTIVERNVNVSNLKEHGIWDILERLSLEETVTYACSHSKILIKEFYANITKKIVKAGDPMYHRVYIRGKILHFSPAVINKFFGLTNTVVTTIDELDREIDQKELEIALTDTFDEKRKGEIAPVELNFEASKGIKINYGNMIFDHILERALNFRARFRLPYPCLIQSILTKQCPELIDPKENTEVIQKPLVVETRIKRKKGKGKKDYKKMLETLKDAEKALIKMELGLRKQTTQCQQICATVHEYIEATLSNVFIIHSGGEIEEAEGDLDSEEEDSEEEEEGDDSEMPKPTPKKAEASKKSGTSRKTRRARSSSDNSSLRF
ncbi:PREDICTED: uncharacterized protein LOC104806030 [Tarenaya hassleriana]|uniref:uncharacterized protein LOC104806030 n=1 Tax=Tarenaya hassleriana TaxID=28532 RepID=UPI00053C2EC5|nr:PREDICTED: uncharacterized protein LOC104806030 [Tarenaya hassleriana]